jgi:uncharacterized protein
VSCGGPAVPDAWPPADEQPGNGRVAPVVPLFPLPNAFLFPGTLMPLHVFEPRYRQMVADSLDGPGRIAIGAVLEPHHDDLAGRPPVHRVAGLGEIARHERLPDGRYMIVLFGLARVAIREVESERLYRKVEAVPLEEQPVPPDARDGLRCRLAKAVLARTSELLNLPDDLPLGHLTDLLLLRLQLPQSCMQDLYSCTSVAERARRALAEHSRRPIPPQ